MTTQDTLSRLNEWKENIDKSFGALQESYATIVKEYLEWKDALSETVGEVDIEEIVVEEKPKASKKAEKTKVVEDIEEIVVEEKPKASKKAEKTKTVEEKPVKKVVEKTKVVEEKPVKKVVEKANPKKDALLERIVKKNTDDGYYNIATTNKLKKTEASIKRGIQYYTFTVDKTTVRIAAPKDNTKELKETFKTLGVDPVPHEDEKKSKKVEEKSEPVKKTKAPSKSKKVEEDESVESESSITIQAGDTQVELYWDGDLLLDENTFVFNPKNKMLVGIQDSENKTKVKPLNDMEYKVAKSLNYKISPVALEKK